MGGVVSTDTATIQTRISEAETARHELAIGALRSWTVQGRTYTAMSLAELDAYIKTLKHELAEASDASDGWGAYGIQIEGAD